MAKKKTQLSSGANSTPQRPYGSGYVQPNVPRWGGAWDAANMMTPNMVSANTTPYFGISSAPAWTPVSSYPGFPVYGGMQQIPNMFFDPIAESTQATPVEDTTGEVPLGTENAVEAQPTSQGVIPPGQRAMQQYAQKLVGGNAGFGSSAVPIWQQTKEEQQVTNQFWNEMANQDQQGWTPEQQAAYIATYYGENGTPRPGDPYQVYPYWKHQRFTTASYGADGQKRKAVPRDPYSFKSRQGVNNTNKYRTPPPDGMATQQQPGLGSIPAWAGDLVSWRT